MPLPPPALAPALAPAVLVPAVLPPLHGWLLRGEEPGDGRPSLEDWEKQVPKSKSMLSCLDGLPLCFKTKMEAWEEERGGAGYERGLESFVACACCVLR